MKTGVRVSDAMTYDPIVVSPEIYLEEAAKLMKKKDIGSLVILEEDKLKGIITEWDIVRKAVAVGKKPKDTKAKDIMEAKLVKISPDSDIYDALLKMRNNDIRHLPVVRKNKLLGFLTLKDILKIQPELFDILVEKWEMRGNGERVNW